MRNIRLCGKKILSIIALMFASFGAMSFTSGKIANAVEPKRYGDIYWDIKESTLTISPVPGTNGAMADIASYDEAPWYYYNDKYSCDYIRSIIIEDGVSHIGTEAFCYFNKVTRIDIPQSCKTVSREAFYNCEGLKEVSVYGSVGYYTFAYCYNLEKVTVIRNEPSDYIAEGAFFNCESLKEVTIQISHICEDSFCYCYSLETINLLEGCINIKNEAFYKCQSLKTLYLPSTLKLIEREAFYDCRSLVTLIYSGSKTTFNNITFDEDYNDVIVDALNNRNGRKVIFKPIGTYYYFDEENIKSKLEAAKETCYFLSSDTTELNNAWYIVDSEVDFGKRTLPVNGTSKILLLNGCGIKNLSCLLLQNSPTLCIYSESLDESKMGYIEVDQETSYYPAIGNSNAFGYVRICGGNISAKASHCGAAIGSGSYGAYTMVDIYGGKINAIGGAHAAGIGSGFDGDARVTIYGGTISAKGGEHGAGIGSGSNYRAIVNIYGGTISTKGGEQAADIGSGYGASAEVNIYKEFILTEPCFIGAGEGGSCIVNNSTRIDYNVGTGTILSDGSIVIVSVIGGVALITACVFVALYIKEKRKNNLA